ncbi:hypothetical protein BC940DRAFT_331615 [Gongronella butleri]|nr:hypothetical protein BC940DRAFT_331615 [Gongronella butleri]
MITDKDILQSIDAHFTAYPHQAIASPPHQKRRGCVAAILRWHTTAQGAGQSSSSAAVQPPTSLQEFLAQSWVQDDAHGRLEILYMLRATRKGDPFSNHVCFPGGKNEPGETDKDTVVREVQEEIGLDLASDAFIPLGKLNDRELTGSNQKLIMILVPFVFLQVVQHTPEMTLEAGEVAAVDWIPWQLFVAPRQELTPHLAQVHESLVPRNVQGLRRRVHQMLLGTIALPAIDLPVSSPLRFRLWGLTLGMTKELIQMLNVPSLPLLQTINTPPTYSHKDIGFWVWCIASVAARRRRAKSTFPNPSLWDKIYFASIRRGILLALIMRGVVAALCVRGFLRWRRHR